MSMIVIAVGVIVGEWNEDYNSGLTYDLETDYDQLDTIAGHVEDQEGRVAVGSSASGEDFESTTYRGAFGIINNIFSPFRVVFGDGGMIDSITERFGIPDYIRQGIITMMVAALIFTLISIIFRRPISSV